MILVLIFGISASFAANVNQTEDTIMSSSDTSTISLVSDDNNKTLQSLDDSNDILSEGGSAGTFTDLNVLIKGTENGGTLTLDNDYIYDSNIDTAYTNGLSISHPITIEGNGHTIDGNSIASLFTIDANNVIIKNVNFINAISTNKGPVIWNGDNGKLINCNFNNTRATNVVTISAGAVHWKGANGTIIKSSFNNTYCAGTSTMSGGAICVASDNLKIYNSTFGRGTGGRGLLVLCTAAHDFYICGSTFKENIGYRSNSDFSIIISQRCGGFIENCTFIDNTATRGTTHGVYFAGSGGTVKNCIFKNNDLMGPIVTSYGDNIIENCTFENNHVSTTTWRDISARSGTVINNCKFSNEFANSIINCESNNIIIKNSNFTNCKNTVVISNGVSYVNIDNCIFSNNIASSNAVIYFNTGGSHTLTNCIFNSNSGTNYGVHVTNMVSSFYQSGNKFIDTTYSFENINTYIEQKIFYVEVGGTSTEGTKNNPSNLTYAIEHISAGGTIYLKKGIYNEWANYKDISCSIIGEEGVIINKGSFRNVIQNTVVKHIIFNNTDTSCSVSGNTSYIDCTFINRASNTVIFTTYAELRASKFINITILDSNLRNNAIFTSGSATEEVQYENIFINNCQNIGNVFSYATLTHTVFSNITITNSNFAYFAGSVRPVIDLFYNSYFEDIIIRNCNCSGAIFTSYNTIENYRFELKDFIIENVKHTVDRALFDAYYNINFNNINIINLNNTKSNLNNIFYFRNTGNTINALNLNNIFNYNSIVSSLSSCNLYDIKVKNMNSPTAFIVPSKSSLEKLDFSNVQFIDCMGILNDNVELKNSKFTDFKGNLKIMGNGVKITNTTFTRGSTNSINDNGACIELVDGNQTYIQDCTFKDNSAYCGGAIYINNVTNSSYIMYCDFSGNTATLHGGAIYIETGIYYFISDDTLAKLSKVDKQNNLYKEVGVKETMSVVWVTVGGTGDGSFASPCAFEDSLDRVSPYGSIMFKGVGLSYIYPTLVTRECLKPGVKFMGNNSRLNNFALVINELASNIEIKNLIFENVTENSVIIWEGESGKITNCKFKDNGGDKVIYGAAIKVIADNLAITNTIFENNIAGNDSISYGGAIYCNASGLTLNNCDFSGNTVYGYGSHIYLDENANNIKIYNGCEFINGNTVTIANAGSAIYILSESNVTIDDSSFTNNKAINGGALNFNRLISTVRIIGNSFTRNSASNNGGAIAFTASSINALSIKNNIFESNSANGYGGAIYSNVAINVVESKFINNGASVGGAIYLNAPGSIIVDSTFTGNTATSYRNIYSAVSVAPTLSGNTFSEATATLNAISSGNYPMNVVLSGTFEDGNNFATNIPILANNNEVASFSLTNSNSFSVTWNNVLPDTYNVVVANVDNNGNKFAYTTTPSRSFTVSRRNVIYVGNTAGSPGYGLTASDPTTWDHVADILAEGGTVYFTSGTYSNFYDKTVSGSWTLRPVDGATVVLDANNKGRIFTVSANNVAINGLTFKNGKVSNNQGSAIHWTGTGGSITNSVFTENTGTPISSTKTITISNSQMKNQITLTKSNINWGSTETITGTFAHSAPSKVTILFDGVSQGEYTVSSSKVTASYAYTNTATRSVGSYVVTDLKNNYEEVL